METTAPVDRPPDRPSCMPTPRSSPVDTQLRGSTVCDPEPKFLDTAFFLALVSSLSEKLATLQFFLTMAQLRSSRATHTWYQHPPSVRHLGL